MREHADELGIDADRIAVMGGERGGGLAAAVAQRSHDEGIPLRAQVLVYPMIDDRAALRDDHARPRPLRVDAGVQSVRMDVVSRPRPRMSRRSRVRGARPAYRSGRPAAGMGGRRRARPVLRGGRRLRRATEGHAGPCELVTVPGMYHGADGLAPKAGAMQDFRRRSDANICGRICSAQWPGCWSDWASCSSSCACCWAASFCCSASCSDCSI